MDFDERRKQLDEVFSGLEAREKILLDPLLDEVVYLESEMKEKRKLPFIRVHPKNKEKQQSTVAARQYKELSQSYMNAIRILISALHKTEDEAQNELLKRLEEFSL